MIIIHNVTHSLKISYNYFIIAAMNRHEGRKGTEALTMLPFRDVVFPGAVAVQKLTDRAHAVAQANAQADLPFLLKHFAKNTRAIGAYQTLTENPGVIFP